jgi:hypothetical protein
VEAWRKKVAQRDVIVVRYADDLVVGFESLAGCGKSQNILAGPCDLQVSANV